MSTIHLEMPSSLHKTVRRLAEQEGTSDADLILRIVKQAVEAEAFFATRTRRVGTDPRQHLLDTLEQAPDVEPEPHGWIKGAFEPVA